jgi:type II secretory pathway pseudopilin PulG
MKNNRAKLNGFILLEVLLSLSVIGVAMVILWQSRINQNFFNEELQTKFSTERLQHDKAILSELNISKKLLMYGYGKSKNAKINISND